jgi:H+-transporting ATPase
VERIRQQGHVTGMTGDGVNDAPALKRADVGIAVAGATDAARAASDLVLTNEGLSVIIDAIFESRKIFQRMRNYIIYRIACTIQLLFFFFFAVLCVEPDGKSFYDKQYPLCIDEPNPLETYSGCTEDNLSPLTHAGEFTLPVISMVIITILNDGCMITISHDQVLPEKKPQRWAMAEMTVVAIVLGAVACVSSLLLLVLCLNANALHTGPDSRLFGILYGSGKDYMLWFEVRTIIYLKVSISDFLTLFSARTRTWFFERGIGRLLGGAAVFALLTSTVLSLVWDLIFTQPGAYMRGLRYSGGAVTNVWIYCVLWWFIQDAAKVYTYDIIERGVLGDLDDKPPELPNGPGKQQRKAAEGGKDGDGFATVVTNPLKAGGHGGGHGHGAPAKPSSDRAARAQALQGGMPAPPSDANAASSAH